MLRCCGSGVVCWRCCVKCLRDVQTLVLLQYRKKTCSQGWRQVTSILNPRSPFTHLSTPLCFLPSMPCSNSLYRPQKPVIRMQHALTYMIRGIFILYPCHFHPLQDKIFTTKKKAILNHISTTKSSPTQIPWRILIQILFHVWMLSLILASWGYPAKFPKWCGQVPVHPWIYPLVTEHLN